jgi:hypothetical protein
MSVQPRSLQQSQLLYVFFQNQGNTPELRALLFKQEGGRWLSLPDRFPDHHGTVIAVGRSNSKLSSEKCKMDEIPSLSGSLKIVGALQSSIFNDRLVYFERKDPHKPAEPFELLAVGYP